MALTVLPATVYYLILLNNARGGEEMEIMICAIDDIIVYDPENLVVTSRDAVLKKVYGKIWASFIIVP